MTQLEKSVFGAGFVAMTEDELYEVNGGRIGGRRENGWHHPRDDDDSIVESGSKTEEKTCRRCAVAKEVIAATERAMFSPHENSPASQGSILAAGVINFVERAIVKNCEKNGHKSDK